MKIDVKEAEIEIRENGNLYRVHIMRNKDGSIWGIFPNCITSDQSGNIIFYDGIRNLLILFERKILKLEDFPRILKEQQE